MVNDPLHGVPALRADDQPERLVALPTASLRDLRWLAHPLRGTLGGLFWLCILGLTWLNMDFLDRSTAVVDLLMLAIVVWWGSAMLHLARRSVLMGRRMGEVVARGVAVWRALPREERILGTDAVHALVAAGQRHDVDGVRVRTLALTRLAVESAGRPYPGYREDVEQLTGWADGAIETHRD